MNNAFGYTIDRAGTVNALKNPAHKGRVVGIAGRRIVWIGSVRRMGSGWAASDTNDVTTHGYRTQKEAAESLYNVYLQS
jgi:hypothetical protein